MAGSAVGLWLFASDDVRPRVVPWLETFCDGVKIARDGDVSFWVRDGTAIALDALSPGETGAFFLSDDECVPADDEDYSAFARPPVQSLILDAGRSGRTHDLVLGHLALALAARLDALIDFDGVLGYPTPRDETRDPADLTRARALVASLPGRVEEVSYDTGGGGRWFRHVGDTEFLAAWLRHPDFHLGD
ncbi:DUF6368 family protein [Actinomadura rugatobispora]|uniref:DUF6368 family protein n=1 Tax=Actinomadura rugatobispora TaxID=1994 RepID=A0ABW1A140_9ACTN|nr:hypothetical protein GCM10010200_042110 [Actinomadura rugatobispora]